MQPMYVNACSQRKRRIVSFTADNYNVGERRRVMFAREDTDNVATWGGGGAAGALVGLAPAPVPLGRSVVCRTQMQQLGDFGC